MTNPDSQEPQIANTDSEESHIVNVDSKEPHIMTGDSKERWRLLFSGIVGAILAATMTFISMGLQNESRKREAERVRRLEVIDKYVRACNEAIMQSERLIASEYNRRMESEVREIRRDVYLNLLELKTQSYIANLTFGQDVIGSMAITRFSSGPLHYEPSKGGIGGTVANQNGAAVHGATVMVIASESPVGSGDTLNGVFNVDNLSPGTYSVKVVNSEFKTALIANVEVLVGYQSVLHIKMQPGESNTVLQVSGYTDSDEAFLESRSVINQASEKQCDNDAKRMFELLPK